MTEISAKVTTESLAKILFIQNMASQLPDERAILDFACRGLVDLPGAGRVSWRADDLRQKETERQENRLRIPVQLHGHRYAEIIFELETPDLFSPYRSYVQNLCFTLAVVLEERRLREENERYQKDLERAVSERTRQLTEEVRARKTAQMQTEAEKNRAERYLDIAEAITLELDPEGRIEVINEWGRKTLGYAQKELIGRNWIDLAVPSDQREELKKAFRKLVSGCLDGYEYYENEIVTRDGERRHVAWHNALRRTKEGRPLGTLSFGSDITDRKRAEESLQSKQADLDHAQAVAHIGSWRMDVQRNQLFWSDEVYRIFGVEKGTSLTFEDFISFVHPEDRPYVESQWEAALKGQPYDIDHRIFVDGAIKWVREKAELEFDRDGKLLGGFGTVQDITDRKHLEFDLLSAMRAAEESNRIKSEFLANMSHELRTPLTAIMGSLQLMQTEGDSSMHPRLLEMADESAHRLLGIIGDLLDFSNIDAGRLKVEELAFDLPCCIDHALERLSLAAREKGMEIAVAVSPELPRRICGDPRRLGQVLENLAGNAIKFSERGKVTIAADRQDDEVVFSVQDTGIGIAREKLEKIFDPFTQVDGSITRRHGGTGLGLTISKELVDLMGGKIWAESEAGRGSTFFFSLPLKAVEDRRKAGSAEGKEKGGPFRVLVVEDDRAIREMIMISLESMEIEASAVEDGLQAVRLSQEENFDLILMDLQMPVMDGLEATRKIRELEEGRQENSTCIFALTAHVRSEDRQECFRAGMDGFLGKPLQKGELETLIKRCSCGGASKL